uniref:hypothetical protein n=1 Tax=Inquilinus sp. OTU3971 TaxID=3043855 RepID=UPI00313C0E9F
MADEVLTRILNVEDDADIRSVAGFALEELGGFVLAACASGEEALAQAPGFAPQLLTLSLQQSLGRAAIDRREDEIGDAICDKQDKEKGDPECSGLQQLRGLMP